MIKWTGTFSLLISLQMALAPMAMGKEAEKTNAEKLKALLKTTGLGSKQDLTVGEFYLKMKDGLSVEARETLDPWVIYHRSEIMPQVNASTFKDKEGHDQARLIISTGSGQSAAVATSGGIKNPSIQVNEVVFDNENSSFNEIVEKMMNSDHKLKEAFQTKASKAQSPDIVLSKAEFESLSKNQRALYMANLRLTIDAANSILSSYYNDIASVPREAPSFVEWILESKAYAEVACPPIKNGQRCIVAGWVSTYSPDLSCGGASAQSADFRGQVEEMKKTFPNLKCQEGFVPCNPLVYGFDRKNPGTPICADARPANYKEFRFVTEKVCEVRSPLKGKDDNENKQEIVKTWLHQSGNSKLSAAINSKNEISADTYRVIGANLKGLNQIVADATEVCDAPEMRACLGKLREDQKSACEALKKRAWDLGRITPEAPVVVPPAAAAPAPAPAAPAPAPAAGGVAQGGGTAERSAPAPAPAPTRSSDNKGLLWGLGGIAVGVIACIVTKACGGNTRTTRTVYVPAPNAPGEGNNGKVPVNPTSPPRPGTR